MKQSMHRTVKAERAVSKELSLGISIWKELTVSASEEEKYDKETIRDRREQPDVRLFFSG